MKTRHLFIALGSVMRRQLLVTSLAGLLPVVAVAAGETVPCPQQKAGQWYRFASTDLYNKTTEYLTKIESVDGDRLFINEEGVTVITDKMHNWHQRGKSVATPKYYRRIECPFSLGEKRIYKDVETDLGRKGRATFTVTVDPEFVAVTVKAGSFKAVKIVSENITQFSDSQSLGGSGSGRARYVSYYVPELGISVKSEGVWSYPWGPQMMRERQVLELLEYSLAN